MKFAKRQFLCLLLSVTFLGACQTVRPEKTGPSERGYEYTQIFLVRHAEKVTGGKNPELSQKGQERAVMLAKLLADANITHIHSSDYRRTLQTAAPLADLLGVEVELYDPRDLNQIAARLKAMGGVHLVVGHSNTTPALTELLGGDPHGPINEVSEYDRLYVVLRREGNQVHSTLLRYGE